MEHRRDLEGQLAARCERVKKPLDERIVMFGEDVADCSREQYLQQWHAEHDPKPGQEPLSEATNYKGNDFDDVKPHLWNFFRAVKSRKPVVEDAVFGHHAALACHMANESYFRQSAVTWDAASKTIKSS